MGSISIRKYIRWLPDAASEPTSTIVVTSPQRHFVDIRILLPPNHKEESSGTTPLALSNTRLPVSRLDWAIAGTSSSWQRDDGHGGTVSRGQWRHWVDSRTREPENATDEGDNYPQGDGTTLEKGVMVNPETGRETVYEEVWIDEEPRAVGGGEALARYAVLQTEVVEDQLKGSLVRVGHVCQGFLRKGDELVAERWEWKGEEGWVRTVAVGEGGDGETFPVAEVLTETFELGVGDALEVGGLSWKVVEKGEKPL